MSVLKKRSIKMDSTGNDTAYLKNIDCYGITSLKKCKTVYSWRIISFTEFSKITNNLRTEQIGLLPLKEHKVYIELSWESKLKKKEENQQKSKSCELQPNDSIDELNINQSNSDNCHSDSKSVSPVSPVSAYSPTSHPNSMVYSASPTITSIPHNDLNSKSTLSNVEVDLNVTSPCSNSLSNSVTTPNTSIPATDLSSKSMFSTSETNFKPISPCPIVTPDNSESTLPIFVPGSNSTTAYLNSAINPNLILSLPTPEADANSILNYPIPVPGSNVALNFPVPKSDSNSLSFPVSNCDSTSSLSESLPKFHFTGCKKSPTCNENSNFSYHNIPTISETPVPCSNLSSPTQTCIDNLFSNTSNEKNALLYKIYQPSKDELCGNYNAFGWRKNLYTDKDSHTEQIDLTHSHSMFSSEIKVNHLQKSKLNRSYSSVALSENHVNKLKCTDKKFNIKCNTDKSSSITESDEGFIKNKLIRVNNLPSKNDENKALHLQLIIDYLENSVKAIIVTVTILDNKEETKFSSETLLPDCQIGGRYDLQFDFDTNNDLKYLIDNLLINNDLVILFSIEAIGDIHNENLDIPRFDGFNFKTLFDLINHENGIKNPDIIIECEDKTVSIHSNVLKMYSSKFYEMINHETHKITFNEEMSFETLLELIRFMYTGDIVKDELLCELLLVSREFKIFPLKILCEKRLIENLNIETAMRTLMTMNLTNSELVKKIVLPFVKANINSVTESKDFIALLGENVDVYKFFFCLM